MNKIIPCFLLLFIAVFFNFNAFSQKTKAISYIPEKFNENFCLIKTNCKTIKEAGKLGEWIGVHGGRIAVIGTASSLLGWIPSKLEKTLLQNAKITGIERKPKIITSENVDEAAVVSYFNKVVTGELEKASLIQKTPGRLDSLGCLRLKPGNTDPSNRNAPTVDMNPMSICQEDKNSEYMIGTVSCGVFFIESDGSIDANTYTWTAAAILDMKTQIMDAFSIWSYTASQNGTSVSFTPVWYTSSSIVNEPYEPISHPSTDDYLYINYIMNNLGYNLGNKFLNTSAFNSDLKTSNGTDWAFSAFVAYNPSPAADLMTDSRGSYAYFGGPYLHVLYRYFGWAVSSFYRTFGHEISHVFHAFDEYSSASSSVCSYSFNGVTNTNYHASPCNGTANCVMNDNSFTGTGANRKWNLCSPTISHIGWQNLTSTPLSLVPADSANILPGTINFSWSRNTSVPSMTSTLRILDSSNTVVYCQSLGSLSSVNVSLAAGDYTWHVLNALYPTTGGYAEVSSDFHSLNVSCLTTTVVRESKDTLVNPSQDAAFSVLATGTGTLNYQWQYDAGGGWTDITDAGSDPVYDGFNSDTLQLSGVVEANNGYLYRCLVYTSCDVAGDTGLSAKLSICSTLGSVSINGNTSSCEGSVEYFSAVAANASTYTWTVPSGCSIDSGQGSANIKVIVGSTSGQICVTPSNSCGNGIPVCLSLTVNPKPSASTTTSGPLSFCSGDSVVISSSVASSYLWSNGETSSSIHVKASGNYSVIVSDLNSCKDTSSIDSVNVFSTTASILVNGTTNLCQGSSTTLIASKANDYLWSNSATTRSISVSTAGSYTVQIIDSNNCSKTSAATQIQVFQLISKSNPINGLTVSCPGNSADYFLSPVTNASTYTWTVPSGSVINSGQGNFKMKTTFGSTSGSVCVVASNGCMSAAASCKYVNIGTPTTPGTITGSTNLCVGGMTNAPYSVAAVPGTLTYLWTLSSGDSVTSGAGTRSILATFKNSSSTVCVKSSNNCGISSPSCLSVISTPSVSNKSIMGSSNVCFAGTANVNYSLSSITGISSFLWTPPSGATVSTGQGTGVVSISYSPSFSSGLLCVRSFNLCNLPAVDNCKLISDAPLIFNNISGQLKVSPGTSNLSYSISVSAGATSYTWTVPNGVNISSGQGTNTVILKFTGAFAGGSLCVQAVNACGSSASKCLQLTSQ